LSKFSSCRADYQSVADAVCYTLEKRGEAVKIVTIIGSPRQEGNTNYLVDKALEEAARLGVDTEKINLGEYDVKPCLGHDNCASYKACLQQDDAGWIMDKFREADGVILATPVYWYNVTAQMKAFIDRHYFPYKHDQKYKAKAVGIIIVAEQEGIEDTLHTLRQFVDWFFDIGGDKIFVASGYANKIGDAQKNTKLMADAGNLGRQMAQALKKECQ